MLQYEKEVADLLFLIKEKKLREIRLTRIEDRNKERMGVYYGLCQFSFMSGGIEFG